MFWLVWNWHVEFYIYPLLKCWHPANIDFKIVWKGYYVSKIKLFNNEAFWNNFIISYKGSNSKCVIYRRKGGGEITINLFDDCQFYHFSFVFYWELASMNAIGWTFCSLTTVICTIINQNKSPFLTHGVSLYLFWYVNYVSTWLNPTWDKAKKHDTHSYCYTLNVFCEGSQLLLIAS